MRFCNVFSAAAAASVFLFLVITSLSSQACSSGNGGIIHVHSETPKGSVCRNNFVLVKVSTFVDGIQIREDIAVGAEFGAMLSSKKNHVKKTILTLSDPLDCCSKPKNKLAGEAILVYHGGCNFTAKANNAEAAGASAVLIVNNDANNLKLVCEDDANIKLRIPVVMLPLDVGKELEALLFKHSAVFVQLSSNRCPLIFSTEVFPWIMVAGTTLCASFWFAWTAARQASIRQHKLMADYKKALLDAAAYKTVLQDETENYEQIIESLEKRVRTYICQAKALENSCSEALCKTKAVEAELDRLKNHHDKTIAEAADQNLVLQNNIASYEQKIEELEKKLGAQAELLKCREVERDEAVKLYEELVESQADFCLTLPSSEVLKAASQYDQSSQLLCEGEFGTVYKAVLYHTQVTLRFFPEKVGLLAFEHEMKILSKYRHPNLANLIGAYPETLALVYEHLPNGSLEDRLKCKDNTRPLSWPTRITIALDLCSALIFLHSHGVIHGALRPCCILLDPNFACKIIDFRFCHKGQDSNCTAPNYTGEYADPEFLATRKASPSLDIYSFGLVLLELLTRQPGFSVLEEVKSCLDQGTLNSLLDTSAGELSYLAAQQLAHLGLRCCHAESTGRPDLASDVWKVLEPVKRSCGSVFSSCFGEAPSYFVCPITLDVMEDPHVAADGYTYEAEVIKLWLEGGHDTSPMTNLPLEDNRLVPNRSLHSAIQEWRQHQRL